MTVGDLFVVINYSMIVIRHHFSQFEILKSKKFVTKSTLQRRRNGNVPSPEDKLSKAFSYENRDFLLKKSIIANRMHCQIELEQTLVSETTISYPVCVKGHLLLYSNVEINLPREFFEIETTTPNQFIDQVFRNGGELGRSRCRRHNNPVSESTLKSWNLWLLNVLQGAFDLHSLIKELKSLLPEQDVKKLYDCILQKPLKHRTKAICMLSLIKGIPKKYICELLGVKRGTLEGFIEKYKSGGVERLLTHKTLLKAKKYERPSYVKEVFSILHSPPSCHGFNRTTWRLTDIHTVMAKKNLPIHRRYISKIINNAGYRVTKARKRLTSNDPNYKKKLRNVTNILSNLGSREKFFSIDEYGPFGIKIYGGRSLSPPGEKKTIPQWQKNKGSLIITAALELSTNQITHFYSKKKNTSEMIKLLNLLIEKYRDEDCIYFSWDAASWHASKELHKTVDVINSNEFKLNRKSPNVKLAPLPTCAQFLNVIESVFSGMARAIIHNSDYQSVEECKLAIDRYYSDRNDYFIKHPKRAGKKIWGQERVRPVFSDANNCKDPAYR